MNIEEKMANLRTKKSDKEVVIYNNPVEKWEMSEKKSKTLAIAAKCAECMGCYVGHIETNFRLNIRNCTSHKCPLYPVRPYQTIKGVSKKLEKVIGDKD